MCRVSGLAAVVLAAAISCLSASCAHADMFRRDDDTLLFFSGTDLWRQGSFSFGGGLWSPGGIDREGLTFKFLGGAGSYRYLSGALGDIEVTGRQFTGFAMAGYRFVQEKTIVTVFAGLDVQDHRLAPDDPTNPLRGIHAGIRGAIEFWYEPDAHSMWAADVSASSVGPSYSWRVAVGWRVFDSFYLGPEAAAFAGDDTYRQLRAGLHITGFRAATVEWSLGAGWLRDSSEHEGFYGRLGMIARR
jgi:hypothetical protein